MDIRKIRLLLIFKQIRDFFGNEITKLAIVFLVGCLLGFIFYPIFPDRFKYQTYYISDRIKEIIFTNIYEEPEWIGTKIEFINRGKVGLSNIESDIIQTDKPGGKNLILQNQDQNLKNINLADKFNSLDFIVWLRRYKNKNEPLCLLTYGERKPRYSQLKNIIQINKFPSDQGIEYDKLLPYERDKLCYESRFRQGYIIISPS
ncbi:MAG: hypothetical protein AAFW70_29945 [Cyanobacteria bacterium J06635_10]